jgi:hypothetical protein
MRETSLSRGRELVEKVFYTQSYRCNWNWQRSRIQNIRIVVGQNYPYMRALFSQPLQSIFSIHLFSLLFWIFLPSMLLCVSC